MINLIPPEGKQTVAREYRVRLVVVALFLLFAAAAIIFALSVPVIVLVRSQLHVYQESYSSAAAKTDEYDASVRAVTEANELTAELGRAQNLPQLLPFFDAVRTLADADIAIKAFTVSRSDTGSVESLTVSGEAATRAGLAAFRDRIEADSQFVSAALPLSNLAKDKDIPFTITVTIAQ